MCDGGFGREEKKMQFLDEMKERVKQYCSFVWYTE